MTSANKHSARQIAGRRRIKNTKNNRGRTPRNTSNNPTPSKAQSILAKHTKRILKGNPSYKQEQTWPWLKTEAGHNMYVDILFKDLKLAIEYNGPQHYMISKYADTRKKLRGIQKRDKLKEELLREHGYTVIQWPYTRSVSLRAVWYQLNDLGFDIEDPPRVGRPKLFKRSRRLVR